MTVQPVDIDFLLSRVFADMKKHFRKNLLRQKRIAVLRSPDCMYPDSHIGHAALPSGLKPDELSWFVNPDLKVGVTRYCSRSILQRLRTSTQHSPTIPVNG